MKTFRLLSAVVFAGVCLMMASCIDSKNPVSDPKEAKVDQKLLGVWRNTGKNGNVYYYHVGQAGDKLPGGVLRAVFVTHIKNGQVLRPGVFRLFTSEIGNSKFLNIPILDQNDLVRFDQAGWDAKLVKGYSIAKYELKDDSLTLWHMNRDAKAKAIQMKIIKGEIKKSTGTGPDSVYFTDTSENLAQFLADPENINLFDAKDSIRYERVK